MFLNKIPEKKRVSSQLIEIIPVSSGKGCVGKTTNYEVFLWEGSSLLENLLGAIAVYCDSKQSVQIWVIPNSKKKDGFELQAIQVEQGFWSLGSNRWYFLEEEVPEGNPLLITKTTYSPVMEKDLSIEATEGALKVAASFGGRIVPEEDSEGVPESPGASRANRRKQA